MSNVTSFMHAGAKSYVTALTDLAHLSPMTCHVACHLPSIHAQREVARAASASGRALAGAATAATLLAGAATLWTRCCRFARRTYAIPRET